MNRQAFRVLPSAMSKETLKVYLPNKKGDHEKQKSRLQKEIVSKKDESM